MTHGTVLLVDDEEKILKTLGRALREDEHEVTTTSSPRKRCDCSAPASSTCCCRLPDAGADWHGRGARAAGDVA